MPNERARVAMSAGEISRFLAEGRTAVLVTLGADGSPEPLGMWYLVEDDVLLMRTYAKSQKVVNLRRDPRCAVLVEDGDRYAQLRGVRLSGAVEVVDDDAELVARVWTGLAVKYEGLAPEHESAFHEVALGRASKQVVLRLRPEDVVSWDHSKLA